MNKRVLKNFIKRFENDTKDLYFKNLEDTANDLKKLGYMIKFSVGRLSRTNTQITRSVIVVVSITDKKGRVAEASATHSVIGKDLRITKKFIENKKCELLKSILLHGKEVV